jgi:peptide deformylase
MAYQIVQVGDPVLRARAVPVAAEEIPSAFIQELAAVMLETMHESHGVGLAGPQVGESLRIVVIGEAAEFLEPFSPALLEAQGRVPIPPRVLINPVIEPAGDDEALHYEGCLSIPGLQALVPRHYAIDLTATDERGEPVSERLEGWPARIVQHEVDHLDGVLFTDRMVPESLTTGPNRSRYVKSRSAEEALRKMRGQGSVTVENQ